MNIVLHYVLMRRAFLVVMAGLCVAGCAQSFPVTNADPAKNNAATYSADTNHCAQSYPLTSDGAYLKRRISCLELKGWK